MFKKLIGAFAQYKSDKDLKRGLAIVQEKWMAYRSLNQKPPEGDIVQFAAPFIVPMMAQLLSDPRWGGKSQSNRLDLIFVVLLADAETEVGQAKLRAMREVLVEKASQASDLADRVNQN